MLVALLLVLTSFRWGFFAHQRINRMAVFALPSEMIRFYKGNISFITEHAVDPDKRRYIDTSEAPKHFIDADRYGPNPFEDIPMRWQDAAEKYGEAALYKNGIVPWQIERSYRRLVSAFRERDSLQILKISADLGHYISDAHVPLHTTENYNGQMTGQTGIHGFWESRLPELFFNDYNFFVGRAEYISDPLQRAWQIVRQSAGFKDSVLLIEARLSRNFPADRKYAFSERNGRIERQYSIEFSRQYHRALKGMVEQQMRQAVFYTAGYWYSAWVDAGQPDLKNLVANPEEQHLMDKEERAYKDAGITGNENH